jgi:hypothetical protein
MFDDKVAYKMAGICNKKCSNKQLKKLRALSVNNFTITRTLRSQEKDPEFVY